MCICIKSKGVHVFEFNYTEIYYDYNISSRIHIPGTHSTRVCLEKRPPNDAQMG